MKLSLRHIGETIIELTIEVDNAKITQDITDLNGFVSQELIDNLFEVSADLAIHNEELKSPNG